MRPGPRARWSMTRATAARCRPTSSPGSLTFEVQADAGPVAAGEIAVALGAVTASDPSVALAGFAAQGASLAGVAEALGQAAGGWFGEGPALRCGHGETIMIADDGAGGQGRGNRRIASATGVPRTLSLSHYDPARDWQIGVQRAGGQGPATRDLRLELPAAIDAGTARTLAEAALLRLDTERTRRTVHLGWEALAVPPGARVRIAGTPGIWRVDGWKLEAMTVSLDCVALAPEVAPLPGDGGRVLGAEDLATGRTVLHAFELPPLDDAATTAPRLAAAAAGDAAGWRRAALLLGTGQGGAWQAIGGTRGVAVLGRIVAPPGPASPRIEDRRNRADVALAHAGMLLDDADAAALDAGANLAMLGDELIQFARAEPLGGGQWRLSGLWRGRRGTEGAIGTQAAGDRFVLLDSEALATIDLPVAAIGTEARLLAEGAGDAGDPAEAHARITGISLLPLAPVHLAARRLPDGGARLTWARRSRIDWQWRDFGDVAPEPAGERYRVTLAQGDGDGWGNGWTAETVAPEMTLGAASMARGMKIEVRQLGAAGLSPAAMLIVPDPGEQS